MNAGLSPRRLLLQLVRRFGGRRSAFTAIYKLRYWDPGGIMGTASGPGSTLEATAHVRPWLESLVRRLGVRTLLDVGCGDFVWMSRADLGDIEYTGADIVEDLIRENRSRYERPRRRFIPLDVVKDPIDAYDLILCRDCLIHLPDADVRRALDNISASGSKYLVTISSPGLTKNTDLPRAGSWRPINLRLPPWNFPEPRESIEDYRATDSSHSTLLGLWAMPLELMERPR